MIKSRPTVLALLGMVLLLWGCAGPQWEQKMVSGSNGPVYEIRAGRSSPPPPNAAQQLQAQSAAQATQKQMQDQLLIQASMLSARNYHDYQVGSEDLLAISFLDADKLTTEARVNGKGEIRLLLIGDVPVEGLTTNEIAARLTERYKKGGVPRKSADRCSRKRLPPPSCRSHWSGQQTRPLSPHWPPLTSRNAGCSGWAF